MRKARTKIVLASHSLVWFRRRRSSNRTLHTTTVGSRLRSDTKATRAVQHQERTSDRTQSHLVKACPGFRVQKWLAGMSLSEATAKKPERTKATQSKTVKASAATVAASAGTTVTALSGMNETSQYIILGFAGITILFGIYIMRERIKAWAEGWK